ncbi:AMP-binding protein [Lachnospiraceae bacterium 54-53]
MNREKRYEKRYEQYEALDGWEKMTFCEHLKRWSRSFPEKTAIISGNETLTYQELEKRAEHTAFHLRELGICEGDHVILQLPNRISFVVYLFALSWLGAVPIMALPAHREAELNGIAEIARPSAYIGADKYLGFSYRKMADNLQNKYSFIKNVILDGEESHTWGTGSRPAVFEPRNTDPYGTAILLLSGGTTGVPKLIPRTHADYMYDAKKASERCGLDERTIFLAVLPVPHNFSLGNPGILGTLMNGGTVVMASSTSPDEVFPLIEKHGVTVMPLVPSLVSLYLEVLEWDDSCDLTSLKTIWVGGAMFEEKTARRVKTDFGCRLQQVFGTAEGLNCFTALDDPEDIACTCQGRPISEADEMKIVDENGMETEPGCYGELLIRGPYTIDGYYKLPEANRKYFTGDGYYRTGDRAMITTEGNLRMGGRIVEQINRAGEKIMPAEIEGYLIGHEDILEAAVIGVPDEELGHRICAFLKTRDDVSMTLKEVTEFLKRMGTAQYKLPDQVEIIGAWPLTSVGKINKKALVQMADH